MLQRWLMSQVNISSITIDLDSTALPGNSSQEGGAKGYNPRLRGRNAHHPLIAFIE